MPEEAKEEQVVETEETETEQVEEQPSSEVETEEVSTEEEVEGEYYKPEEIPKDFEKIDPNKLPPELRAGYNRMLAAHTQRESGLADARKKAELWDYVTQHPEFLARIQPQQTVQQPVTQQRVEDQFVSQLNLPEDNELTPALKALATMMVRGFGEQRSQANQITNDRLKDRINVFVDQKTGLRADAEFVQAMDRIGMDNPKLFNDLDRLYKYASAELGRSHKSTKPPAKDINTVYKEMKEAKLAKVPRPSGTLRQGDIKKAKNVAEAWAQAESQMQKATREKRCLQAHSPIILIKCCQQR
jgi:hypothetical protein